MEHLKEALIGQAPALTVDISLGWKVFQVANTLVYYEHLYIQSSLMFQGKAGAYSSEAAFMCSTLGQAHGLPTYNRFGWKGYPETNTLAYCEKS